MESLTSVPLLGEYVFSRGQFPKTSDFLNRFQTAEFRQIPFPEQFLEISQALYHLIKEAPEEAFLISHVVDFISRLNALKCLVDPYKLSHFEFWLNQLSEISYEENLLVRAKIMGQYYPREEYQAIFPIGMGKIYEGTHFVSAHHSPDVDTMIASFWGWVDAFSARVGDALHIWSLPGGPPESPVTDLFKQIFGREAYRILCRASDRLTLAGIDVLSRKNMVFKPPDAQVSSFSHSTSGKAILYVDQNQYKGDWRMSDVEEIQQVVLAFTSCLRWFENNLNHQLLTLFSQQNVHREDIPLFVDKVFNTPVQQAEPVEELQDRQKNELDQFLKQIIGLEQGLKSTFLELSQRLKHIGLKDLSYLYNSFLKLETSDLFTSSGQIDESRSKIFKYLQTLIQQISLGIQHAYKYCNRLDIVMQIKEKVFQKTPHTITLRTDVNNIRDKIQDYEYLSVVISGSAGSLYPAGVVWAKDIRKPILGSVTFRDFCNQEEVHMASYLNVISVVDHHKSSLKTDSTPMVLIGDVQSCNVLVAEQAFQMNDHYSLGNQSLESIENQIHELSSSFDSLKNGLLLKRLLDKRLAAQTRGKYFIHPEREFCEYFLFIHAIFDDTDLLTKVSARDVECIVLLLNKMKSLIAKKEVEILTLDDIPRNKSFAQNAAKRILQHPDTHSLYQQIYALKEKEVETSLKLALEGNMTSLFADTKEQNGCCRVGQTKIFRSNNSSFQNASEKMRAYWLKNAKEVNEQSPQIDLHMHMISTIPSASEVFKGRIDSSTHKDEIWFWIPDHQEAYDHLIRFLTAFQATPPVAENDLTLEIQGPKSSQIQNIFATHFSRVSLVNTHENLEDSLAILRFNAGTINSRKAMISPYLPRLLT